MWNPVLADWENSGARRGQSPCVMALSEGCLMRSALTELYACWGFPSFVRSSLVLEHQVAAKSMITMSVSPQLRGHLHGRPSLLSLGRGRTDSAVLTHSMVGPPGKPVESVHEAQ